MEILVFKTNVRKAEQITKVGRLLAPILTIVDWNFDLSDRDRILRIVTTGVPAVFVESLLQAAGVYCSELED